jgi:hypothetical protein
MITLVLRGDPIAGAWTNTQRYDMRINRWLLSADSIWNFSIGNGAAGRPSAGNVIAIGNMAGQGGTNATGMVALGYQSGYGATNAQYSFISGYAAGYQAVNSNNLNALGNQAAYQATTSPGLQAFGPFAGWKASASPYMVAIGYGAGRRAWQSPYSIHIGAETGTGASAGYQTLIGFRVGDSSQHNITGASNVVIGTNITTPATASARTLNIGGVIFGENLYGTTTGAPSKTAQVDGRVAIGGTDPNDAAILHLETTTMGFLPPRMSAVQASAIPSPPNGLVVYVYDTYGAFTSVGLWCLEGGTWKALSAAGSVSGVSSVSGTAVDNTDPANPVITTPLVEYGRYTPTFSSLSGISAIDVPLSANLNYHRIGQSVTVYGMVEIDHDGGAWSVEVDVPFGTSFEEYFVGGTGCPGANPSAYGCFKASGSGSKIVLSGYSEGTSVQLYNFSFDYTYD